MVILLYAQYGLKLLLKITKKDFPVDKDSLYAIPSWQEKKTMTISLDL